MKIRTKLLLYCKVCQKKNGNEKGSSALLYDEYCTGRLKLVSHETAILNNEIIPILNQKMRAKHYHQHYLLQLIHAV